MTFRKQYFFLAVLLLVVEILIALYVHDNIIRPYVGDFLVVILIYCFVRSFFKFSVVQTAIGTLLFAYLVELLQYLNLVQRLGLQDSKFANTVLGNLFEWIDIVAYTLGVVFILLIERIKATKTDGSG